MKIGVIGAGRLGICLALLIENAGYQVLASDARKDYIHELQQGIVTSPEPEVAQYVWNAKNIEFTVSNERVIKECDIIFTLVATPSNEDGSYNVSAVWDVVKEVQQYGEPGKSFVVGCTTNPGDCDKFKEVLNGIDVYYNPEFIAQGSIIRDLQNADMVLIGGNGHHVSELEKMYEGIQMGYRNPSIYFMSTKAAEVTKIALNCFLTTKISYANMLGQVLIESGMDDEVDTVLKAIGSDSRVGNKYLRFGYGFGGPCFPRDNRAFASHAKNVGVEFNIGETTDNFNNAHAEFLKQYFIGKNKDNLPFCFKYLTYKSGTDIFEESQQYRLCIDLLNEGYTVYCMEDKDKDKLDDRIIFNPAPIEPVCWIDL
jgi:nucleotide sugar dehydrogenase